MNVIRQIPWVWRVTLGAMSVYFGSEFAIWLLFRRMGMGAWSAQTLAELKAFRLLVSCVAAFAYGMARATTFHPVARKGYLAWLRTTPWHPGMRLPLGPVAFASWDAIVLVVVVLVTLRHPLITLAMLVACAIGYLLFAFMILRATLPWCAYFIALGAAFCFRFALAFPWAELIALGLFVFAHAAMIWSLRGFPWEKDPSRQPPESIGWLSMIPPNCQPLVSVRIAIATCVMIACWVWAIISVIDVQSQLGRPDATCLSIGIACFGSLTRVVIYCQSYRPPTSLPGRLLSRRLVIPGYDYALLAPAVAPVAAGAASFALAVIGASPAVIAAGGIAASIAVLLLAPPSFRNWQLTGFHRRLPFRRDTVAKAQQRTQYPSLARFFPE